MKMRTKRDVHQEMAAGTGLMSNASIVDMIPSLHIWRSLNRQEPHSILFDRAVHKYLAKRHKEQPHPRRKRIVTSMSLVLLPLVIALSFPLITIVVHFAARLISPTLVPASYLIYGLVLVLSVCSAIGREQELKNYPILSVTPLGRFGLHWHYCRRWIHHSFNVRMLIAAILCLGTAAAALGYSVPLIFRESANTLFARFSHPITVGIFYALDYIQTLVIASLLAMLVPALQSNRMAALQIAVGGLLSAQLLSYGLVALISAIFYGSADSLWYSLITLAAFGLVREGLIVWLWRRLLQELNSSPEEVQL